MTEGRTSSWRGVYVEYSADGKYMLVWDGLGFLGACTTRESLWSAIVAARKGSPPQFYRHEAKPQKALSNAEEQRLIEEWIAAHPNIRVPVRSTVEVLATDPAAKEKQVSNLKKALMGLTDGDREALLKTLMEEDDKSSG